MNKFISSIGIIILATSASVIANVTPEQAEQLGKNLTPLGAEMASNLDGTIPTWSGGLHSTNTAKSKDNGRPENPFPNDKPLFVITNANLTQYQDNLSPGQIAMFNKYADYKMPIYQTRRTAAYSEEMNSVVKKNATTAKLIKDGYGVSNFDRAIPFPIATNAMEILWNHITRFRGGSLKRFTTAIPVQANGSFVPVKLNGELAWPEYLEGGRDAEKDDNILFYYKQQITGPARLTGTALLVHETMDQVKDARRAWVYNSGQRRVRRAPNVAYDGPGAGTDGLRTSDNFDMYNGAPDRYNWKLIGKKEIYIPYNSYKLLDMNAKYSDIINAGYLNPEYLRYELHRVWEIEAELKEGFRHIYAKRTMFIDEDSWGASVIDHYDGRGELWKVAEAHNMQFYDVDTPWLAAETLHDLSSGRYLVTGLANEEPTFILWGNKVTHRDFSTSALRRTGR
ncbi:MAG: hypothetical protein ACI936_001255 [Paraglaciecola sp.]|jgi:hypothetical protein